MNKKSWNIMKNDIAEILYKANGTGAGGDDIVNYMKPIIEKALNDAFVAGRSKQSFEGFKKEWLSIEKAWELFSKDPDYGRKSFTEFANENGLAMVQFLPVIKTDTEIMEAIKEWCDEMGEADRNWQANKKWEEKSIEHRYAELIDKIIQLKEIIEEADFLASQLEDVLHGEEGKKITKMRGLFMSSNPLKIKTDKI